MYGTQHNYNGMRLVLNEINANNTYSLGNVWTKSYQCIRRANTVFARIDEAVDLTPTDRAEILALNRFMRAYAYYKIWLNFGPAILIGDEEIPSNLDLEDYDRPRATNDETVEYMLGTGGGFEVSARDPFDHGVRPSHPRRGLRPHSASAPLPCQPAVERRLGGAPLLRNVDPFDRPRLLRESGVRRGALGRRRRRCQARYGDDQGRRPHVPPLHRRCRLGDPRDARGRDVGRRFL